MQAILNLKTDLMDCVPGSVGHVAADAAVVAAVDLGRVSAFSGSEIQSLVDCFCLVVGRLAAQSRLPTRTCGYSGGRRLASLRAG